MHRSLLVFACFLLAMAPVMSLPAQPTPPVAQASADEASISFNLDELPTLKLWIEAVRDASACTRGTPGVRYDVTTFAVRADSHLGLDRRDAALSAWARAS